MSWYLTCLRRYADFNGRASRSELWWFVLPNAAVATVLNALARAMIPEVNPYTGSFEGGSVPGMLFFVVLSLAFDLAVLIPTLAVWTRRLHDVDRSGWWQLIGFVPLVGLVLIFWGVQEGTGANRFGRTANGLAGTGVQPVTPYAGPTQFGSVPQQFGGSPQFGSVPQPAPQFGSVPQPAASPQFGAAPQFGSAAQFGSAPQFGAQPAPPVQLGPTLGSDITPKRQA